MDECRSALSFRLAKRILGLDKLNSQYETEHGSRPDYLMVDVSIIARNDVNTGIQRVVRSVWRELHRLHLRDMEIVPVMATSAGGYFYARPDFLERRGAADEHVLMPCRVRRGDVFLGLDLVTQGLPSNRREIAMWRQLGIPIHIVIYDLLPVTHLHWFNRRTSRHFRRWLDFVADYADTALCISDQVTADVEYRLADHSRWQAGGSCAKKIRLGSDILDVASSAEETMPPVGPINPESPFVLMVGTIEPRKGYEFALDVFESIWTNNNEDISLVIAGRPGWKTDRLQRRLREHPLAGKLLFWLDSVDDYQLIGLYSKAAMLFSASRAEGFGLPIVEARAQGLRVLATDLPVFREFRDEGIMFFDAGNVRQAAEKVEKIIATAGSGKWHIPSQSYSWREASLGVVQAIGLGERVLAA